MSASNVKVLHPSGILTAKASQSLLEEFRALLEIGVRVVLVELQDVNFIDSSGLGILVSMAAKLRSQGGNICICSPNDQVRCLFDITDMSRIIPVFNNQDEFYAAANQN
jgi:anti-anti-sigma factor